MGAGAGAGAGAGSGFWLKLESGVNEISSSDDLEVSLLSFTSACSNILSNSSERMWLRS
jgi:hypothetical protein